MNAHDELQRQLGESVARRRRVSRRRPSLITALSLAVTLGVIAVVAVALASGRSEPPARRSQGIGPVLVPPNPGIPGKAVDWSVIVAATVVAARYDADCSLSPPLRPLTLSVATPDARLLAAVPALTRGQGSTSLPVGLSGAAAPVNPGPIYVRYVRRARVVNGLTYWLMPVGQIGRAGISVGTARACDGVEVAALDERLARAPRAERAATRRYGMRRFAWVNARLRISMTLHDGLDFLTRDRDGAGGGGGGFAAATIERSGVLAWTGAPGGVQRFDGVVPAGVARVRLRFASRTFSGTVVNDVFVIFVPPGMGQLAAMVWLSPSGASLRTIDERSLHA